MISPGTPIQYSDLAALAALANTKLSPVSNYVFTAFAGSDQISMPSVINASAAYTTSFFADGSKVTLWLFGYKTISGVKTYTWTPVVKAFIGKAGSGTFVPTWTWTNPTGATAPDGYIAVIPQPFGDGWQYCWKDIGLVSTLTEDSNFTGYSFDVTLDANNNGNPSQNLPCAHGTWLKTLNQIHNDLFTNLDLFGGSKYTFNDNFLLSGPWCVSVAPKCYLFLNSVPCYNNLQFWYSEADSLAGNQLAPEADMFGAFIFTVIGANSFTWDRNVVINGRIVIFSPPAGQNESDWTVTASHPGITISFNNNYTDLRAIPPLGFVTAFIFDFTNVQYELGTPVVLTCTPLAGGSILGGSVDCVFTGDIQLFTASNQQVISIDGVAAKSVSLADTLTNIVCHPNGGTNSNASHWRSFCNGVFVANTLATLGIFPYLDVDLPQYQPGTLPADASTRRIALNTALPYIASVDNRGALWPVFRDTDFTPDSLNGKAFAGSKAWQVLGTKYVFPLAMSLIPPSMSFQINPTDVPDTTTDLRFLSQNPASVLYLKKNAIPTLADYDATAPGGTWLDISSIPNYNDNSTWFAGVYNPTGAPISTTLNIVQYFSSTAPNGTFFPTVQDASNPAIVVPQMEGFSYNWTNPNNFAPNPIPLVGYCVYSVTVRRLPVDNGSGIAVAPSTGTSALAVSIGLMEGFGFDASGTFAAITTITIPTGQASVTQAVFLPVLSGTPLAYQSTEAVFIRAAVNFQPLIHSEFDAQSTTVNGASVNTGTYSNIPFFDANKAMLSFPQGDLQQGIELPISSQAVLDLQATLNLL